MHTATQHEAAAQALPEGYSKRLYNADLGSLVRSRQQTWNWYNIFAFWMSDVHSVGGYVFAASLFSLGLRSWQVLVCLLVGITLVMFLCNLVAKPSQVTGVPYPVACRLSFGIYGAYVPAMIRGLIAVAWYGIQTYLASSAFIVVILRFWPSLGPWATHDHSFLGLSTLGWFGFMAMWTLQAIVFWNGMDAIKRFIDWAGPAVYVVMVCLAGWIVWKAGFAALSFDLSEGAIPLGGGAAIWQMAVAIALVVSYFSGPMLNFGDFSRYARTYGEVKRGNFWGLPINFLFFSIVTVITTAGTLPVFGQILHDPIETVARIDSTVAAVVGAFTFVTATIGINIVANFVSAAFDFSNCAPSHISWRGGGMLAATGAVFITPWNLFNSPAVIHYTLDVLASFIGPLFGILVVDFYLVKKQKVDIDALYSEDKAGRYYYERGINGVALKALVPGVLAGLFASFLPGFVSDPSLSRDFANFAWFIGVLVGGLAYRTLAGSEAQRPLEAQAASAKALS
jgi:NCS1 family nucleobase:cation symporter-1